MCCVSSKNLGKSILKNVLEQKLINKRDIRFYHGDAYAVESSNEEGETVYHKDLKDEDFKNVDESWSNAKLLVYTGTLTCGVSYNPSELEKHFDTFINVFQKGCGLASQFVQGFARCRKFNQKNHTLYIQH